MKYYHLIISFLLLSQSSFSQSDNQLEIVKLLCNHTENPTVSNISGLNFSWQLQSALRNQSQSAYRILVADNLDDVKNLKGKIWDSKKVVSDKSILVHYNGKRLNPAHQYFWKVKVWDQDGIESEWSDAGTFQTGLFSVTDWGNAQWIGYEEMPAELKLVPGVHGNGNDQGQKALQRPVVPLFRKNFAVQKAISSATLFVSGLGQYEAFVNGAKVSESFLAPGWTNYEKTVFYNVYDITKMVDAGENSIGAIVGNGFYNINRERYRKLVIAYGMPKMLCRLQIEYTDGTKDNIVSDLSWKTFPSPVTYTSIYGGEDYDARLEQQNWNKPGFDDSSWRNVQSVTPPAGTLTAETDYPLKVMNSFDVKNIIELNPNLFLYDFGQNASGIIELKIKGKKGQEVRLIPAELITKDKHANQKATGDPYYFSYILKGDGVEVWRPRFSYYGFRYVQVEGASPQKADSQADLPQIIELKMLHTRNSTPLSGTFECSNDLFNRIFSLINWSIRSNLQSVLTDCPHREKLGWLEVTQLMGNSIHFNYDIYHFYSKMVEDMIQSQTTEGLVPDIAPEFVKFGGGFRDSPEWGSASIILPWLLYEWYGDASVLEKSWPMMLRYVSYLKSKSDHHIVSHGLGDWFDMGPKQPGESQLTPKSLTATAIYYYDLKLLSKIAGVLGKSGDQQNIAVWSDSVKTSFNKKFFNKKTGVIATGSQTSMAMPWSVGLVDPEYREIVINNLEDSIRANGKALTAGDVGFHYLVEALTKGGKSQLLYEMNNRSDVPGYGFQLSKGATALTESWPALENVSNNHLMLGHLMEWFYSGLGGIGQSENSVAYKEITIKPDMIADLSHATASYDSSYGLIKCNWKRQDKTVTCVVEIPVNTSALITFVVAPISVVSEGGRNISEVKDVKVISKNNGRLVCKVGSGSYSFKIDN
jgi:alpha-L-rhamnosidase